MTGAARLEGVPTLTRRPLDTVLAIAVGASSAVVACTDPAAPAFDGPPPNVLLIVMDTTRADHCSTDGYVRPTTPSLARLAASGVSFRDVWSPAGWTPPAHGALFTGLRPSHNGMLEGEGMYLREEFQTLAEFLRDAGWATGCFTNNEMVSPRFGLVQGFDTTAALYELRDVPRPWARGAHDRALAFATQARDAGTPFFAFVNDLEPHQPYDPPAEFLQQIGVSDPTGPAGAAARRFDNPQTLRVNVGKLFLPLDVAALLPGLYDGEIAHVDAEIGRLISGLDAAGLLDSTLVVVTADHGENLGDHGLWGHRFSLHRSVRRVPLVMRLPGLFEGGREVHDPVRLEDVMPSILEVCGVENPGRLDGESLLRDLPGRICRASWGSQRWVRADFVSEYPDSDSPLFDRRISAVYDGRYDLMECDDGTLELYDVRADPGEAKNLATELPEVVARLRELLDP